MIYEVLLFYKYITIENPIETRDFFRKLCEKNNLKGRIIVAGEGINVTVEGTFSATAEFISEMQKDSRFKDVSIKRSQGAGSTFPKLSVKVRSEIVSTYLDPNETNPRTKTAPHIKPEELRSWYESEKDFVVVDMRNQYEFISGHFKNAIDLELENSRDLPKALPNILPLKEKTVVAVCTGGVRCEKMSAYLLHKGFKDVYQLEDGIHAYMEKYPGKDFLGTLYTFDQRIVMDFGGEREIIGCCRLCSEKTEHYVNCANQECHLHFLACEKCLLADGTTFCGNECKEFSYLQSD